MTAPKSTPPSPLVVVHGEATAEEVAALTTVVAAIASQASAAPQQKPPASQWASRARMVRGSHTAGPGGWRASALPR